MAAGLEVDQSLVMALQLRMPLHATPPVTVETRPVQMHEDREP